MRMPGDIEDAYVRARRVLLDALEALADHLDAVILVGAQAIYLHVGEGELAVAVYTSDGDLALDPAALADDPKIDALMRGKGFTPDPDPSHVGRWIESGGVVPVDLMVPDAVAGEGRRSADLGPHGNRIARRAKGLEAALVDRSKLTIAALDPADNRQIVATVAGPAALLVAKLHKIYERRNSPNRLNDKDASDVYRLLRAMPTEILAETFLALLSDERSQESVRVSLSYLRELFGTTDSLGSRKAAENLELLLDPEETAAACAILAGDLLVAIKAGDLDTPQ
jgi:hypothetical protein